MDNQITGNANSYDRNHTLSKTKDNALFSFVLKKSERIVAAIYMISGILSDSEPLKWHLRKQSIEFLSQVRELHGKQHAVHADALAHCAETAENIIAVLEIGRLSGLISEMNFTLLKNEYAHLVELLRQEPHANGIAHDIPLSKEFMHVEREAAHQKPSVTAVAVNLQIEEHHDASSETFLPQETTKEHIGHIKDSNLPKESVLYNRQMSHNVHNVTKEKGKRRATILKILQKKSDLTIKDIAQAIPGYSEKTVQRELISLMSEGLITRAGERRWSRYSLA
jgi:DNA-binding transcriptional ArsR family regulator